MSYYSACDDQLDLHYCGDCNDVTEKARVRRGGWLHSSGLAAAKADPTNAATWLALIAAGKFIVLPELNGSFDGGTPKYGTGYGDVKEKLLGFDFVATLKDPVYKVNWPHYRSLVGKTTWHLVYISETQLHIAGKPVSVAPKNVITENLDDDVIWESEVKWFEEFTPAPHDAPLEVFVCDPTSVPAPETETTTEFRYFNIASGVPIQADIDAATVDTGTLGANLTVPTSGFGNGVTPKICFMAEPSTEPEKVAWYNTVINNGAIGVGETFLVPVIVGSWRVYYTAEATAFTGSVEFKIV